MQAAKETAANIMASANSGMEKTKATAMEKAEQMRTSDPLQKEAATQKKDAKIQEAERQKEEARQQNSTARHEEDVGGFGHGYTAGGGETTTGAGGHHTAEGEQGVHDGGAVGAEHHEGANTGGAENVGCQDPNVAGGGTTATGQQI